MASKGIKKTIKSKKGIKTSKNECYNICKKHCLTDNEVYGIQQNLLKWYDKNQRVLPWRDIAKTETDPNIRGYSVWVSEIMLQQTQVATVIPYFNNWMKKWPTIESLASADIEEVNKVWAGLGYYSRARRLHDGAKLVTEKLNGNLPQTVNELMNLIPGIGLYSASAIASVAFQKYTGVVDGNVIRVLSRMRVIGVNGSQSNVRDYLWELANKIVSEKRPGDFNQALMELGALVCTPRNPKCSECPVNKFCAAYQMVKENDKAHKGLDLFLKKTSNTENAVNFQGNDDVPDIENTATKCDLCLPETVWKKDPQVTVFPLKAEKKSARIERVGVVVIQERNKLLMLKRPDTGLLAGLWEFPNVVFDENASPPLNSSAVDQLLKDLGVPSSELKSKAFAGEVLHIFSHIHTTYVVEHLILKNAVKLKDLPKEIIWLTSEEVDTAAVSTAMKKVLAAVKKSENTYSEKKPSNKKRKCSSEVPQQKSIKCYFS